MPRIAWLCCPAYPLAGPEQLERARSSARQLCAAVGLALLESPLLTRHPGVGAWLPAAERIADLHAGLRRADVLLAARGGYGCVDLLDAALGHSGRRPVLVGFSDLTALHAAWWTAGGPPGVYGLMPGLPHGSRALHSTAALLRGAGVYADHGLHPLAVGLRHGQGSGRIFPACLRVLAGLVGTPAQPDLRGCLLAIEDVDERPYRVARDLWQLQRAGCLEGVTGIIAGEFPASQPDHYAGPSSAQVVADLAERLGVPAVHGLPFGHTADPLALPVGGWGELNVGPDGWALVAQCPRGEARAHRQALTIAPPAGTEPAAPAMTAP